MNMFKSARGVITVRAYKGLRRAPKKIAEKLPLWIDAVEASGLESIRIISGYHDEPLKGKRLGQRSIRLNRSYRAIYEVIYGNPVIVQIQEVTKHDY